MGSTDWRLPDAYEALRVLDAPGFAWEFLRRSPEFRAERAALADAEQQGMLDQARADAFARHWGVRFREGRGRRRRRPPDVDRRRASNDRRSRERPRLAPQPGLSAARPVAARHPRIYRRA